MDVQAPLASLSPTLDMRILTVLVRTESGFTSGDLARLTGASRSGVTLALERLTQGGIVDVETHGRTNSYRLNREHLLADALLLAAGATARLKHRAADLIAGWTVRPEQVILFGSSAREDGNAHSDIDLLVVRPDEIDPDDPTWSRQLTELQESVRRWTGNPCEVLTLARSKWLAAQADHAYVAADVERDGITLFPLRPAA